MYLTNENEMQIIHKALEQKTPRNRVINLKLNLAHEWEMESQLGKNKTDQNLNRTKYSYSITLVTNIETRQIKYITK